VALFTCVSRERALAVIATLVEEGLAPPETRTRLEYVDWQGNAKDLRFIGGADPQEVLLVDDLEQYVLPAHRASWIPVQTYAYPYDSEDRELERVREQLEARLGLA
jgi:hypothetical protein